MVMLKVLLGNSDHEDDGDENTDDEMRPARGGTPI